MPVVKGLWRSWPCISPPNLPGSCEGLRVSKVLIREMSALAQWVPTGTPFAFQTPSDEMYSKGGGHCTEKPPGRGQSLELRKILDHLPTKFTKLSCGWSVRPSLFAASKLRSCCHITGTDMQNFSDQWQPITSRLDQMHGEVSDGH